MNRAIAISLMVLFFASYSEAAFTDFDSLPLSTVYPAGETFQSDDLSFGIVDFNGENGVVRVQGGLHAGGSGRELSVYGLDLLIPPGTNQISMLYAISDPTHGLIINGFSTSIGTKFRQLHGTSIDGVLISAVLNPGQGEQGVLTLNGPISSFVIGGRELWIDDVSVIVPEPSTAALLLATGVSLLTRRRRRYT